ncbi:MAG: DUF4349 domain-containing protein [Bacteroidales bacterium]|nr:MAG: DUF4349 domain-containing protein [Bacteroidales bacterium]
MKTNSIILLFGLTLMFSCSSKSYDNGGARALDMKSESIAMLDEQAPPPPPPQSVANTNIDRKIIKTAFLNIEVLNLSVSRKLIDSALKEYSAYIVSENLQNTETQISSSINIKVPAIQFDILLAKLSRIAKKIDYQNIETQDVTEEYIDVESRLSNSRKVEQTYLKLLKRANTIEDMLKIEQKLGEIRTEIESTQGRLKYLTHQVSYSTINLSVYETLEYKYIAEKLPSFFQQLKKSISAGWRGVVTFFLFLIKLWPLWLIGAAGWFGWKYFIRHQQQKRKEMKRRKKMLKKEELAN